MRIPFKKMHQEFFRILSNLGMKPERAELCAKIFTETSCDGVYSHGLNRFPKFVEYIESGLVDIHAFPDKVNSFGALEQWDGNRGPGILNAHHCMQRAINLAEQNGMGCVALKNTNHWLRGGTYGRQAAEAGFMGICWSNTEPNLPAWGAAEPVTGNNPLVIAIPRKSGHIVLDMAMSQFAYGKLETYRRNQEKLPFAGGYDLNGQLTDDPALIEQSRRPLPIGYWKGSGLALVLDMMAAILSGGLASFEIQKQQKETMLSQVFIAFDISKIGGKTLTDKMAQEIIDHFHSAKPKDKNSRIYYPGERTLEIRSENLQKGIPVDKEYWHQILNM